MGSENGNGVAVLCGHCRIALRLPCLPSKKAGIKARKKKTWPQGRHRCRYGWLERRHGHLSYFESAGLQQSIQETGCDFCQFLVELMSSREATQWLLGAESLKLTIRWLAQIGKPVTGWLFQLLVWYGGRDYEVEPLWKDELLVLSFPVSSRSSRIVPPVPGLR